MKIRTDFVTNSSSSSFTSVVVFAKSGKEFQFSDCDCGGYEEYSMPKKVFGKVLYEQWDEELDDSITKEISSIPEMMDILFKHAGIRIDEKTSLPYQELLSVINGFQDIKKIEVTNSDSAWEGVLECDEDQLDEDGCVTSESTETICFEKIDTIIVSIEGTGYLGRAQRFEDISVGDNVVLKADYHSPYYSPVAIEVFNSNDETLGYLAHPYGIEISLSDIALCIDNLNAKVVSVTPLSKRRKNAKHALMNIELTEKENQ